MAETTRPIAGLHHITAIATDPRTNLEFYTRVLGLRLVKKTVNFDDPGTYHLYFGDQTGRPGTLLTFFPWPGARRGSRGVGQATVTSFSVPEGSLGWWAERLDRHGVLYEDPDRRLDEEVLTLLDPDGLKLELVAASETGPGEPWGKSPVPVERAVRGFSGVTLTHRSSEATARFLTETLGFRRVAGEGGRLRFEAGSGGAGARVDLLETPSGAHGRVAAGTVHHVAFRVADDEDQKAWREVLAKEGLNITPVLDRQYFHSVYFREPGGVLFELATDPPGFTLDEPVEELGTRLKLPPWLEPHRARIEEVLPDLAPAPEAA
jgi:glyoxalase family protein